MAKRLPFPIWFLKIGANIWKTIIVNFRLLSAKDAWKLPIIVLRNVNIKDCTGTVSFTQPIHRGMLIIGETPNEIVAQKHPPTRFKIAGKLIVGDRVHLRGGGAYNVGEFGELTVGSNININNFSRIWCVKKIVIGDWFRTSWEVQLMDSNFHYLVDNKGKTTLCSGEIIIGNCCWIGNRVTLNKGTILPNKSIVGSGSFVNKDFTQYGEGCIIGGMPAKYIKSGYRRLFNREKQMDIDRFFREHPEEKEYFVGNEII